MKTTHFYFVLFSLLLTNLAKAQVSDEELDDFLGFNDTVNDVPAATIDVPIFLFFMVIWSLFIGYKKYRIDKKYKKKSDNRLKTATVCHSVPKE
ncbi:MAG: hypothetical protein ACOVLC_10265 [Flavobacterium sp.]